jgi:hypothetical protein
MSTQMPNMSPEQIRVEMKRRFDAVNEAAETRHRNRRELDDIKEAKAHNRPSKDAGVVVEHDGKGEKDPLDG